MDSALKRLRVKFIILGSLISLSVIVIMLLILNFLMGLSYINDRKTESELIEQTAMSNAPAPDTEYISFETAEKTADNGFRIKRNPRKIESVTLFGEISCTTKNADWYCAGGGLIMYTTDGRSIYRKYAFNRDVKSITIDFSDYDNIIENELPAKVDKDEIDETLFIVSDIWWTSASDAFYNRKSKVTLQLTGVEIKYSESLASGMIENYSVVKRSFSDIYQAGVPEALNDSSGFYFVTDKNNRLIEINNGNSGLQITEDEADAYISSVLKHGDNKIRINDAEYYTSITKNDNVKVFTFLYDGKINSSVRTLMMYSVISGTVVFLLLFLLIYQFSGTAVKPVVESYEKQKRFISNASHELKTPLTVISATADIMRNQTGDNKWLDCIKAQSEKMTSLISEMLELTRLSESDRFANEFRNFDVSRKVMDTLLYFESRAYEEHRFLSSNIQPDVLMYGHEGKTEQLVSLLIDNALKYSDVESNIEVRLFKEHDNIILECENLCSNFNQEDKTKLFDRFYRSDKNYPSETEGYGLGLSIAKAITELHKGKLGVDYVNKNVIFKAVFPAAKA